MNDIFLSGDKFVLNSVDPISRQIYAYLKRAIIECRLMPGDHLSENEVSAKFNISRQPVREALIKLSENHCGLHLSITMDNDSDVSCRC